MKLKSKGAFFVKDKKNDILFIMYIRTNNIIKKNARSKIIIY